MESISFVYSLPYICLLFAYLLLMLCENRIGRGYSRIMCCFLFVFFFGGRGFIGWDWTAYYDIYESFPSVIDSSFINELLFRESENKGVMEKGFLVYLALMKSFGFNYFMFVFFSVFIDVLLVDRFIQRFCPNYALAMLLFVYVYCNAEINLQRNMKSIVLFLYSLQYVEQKKIIPFMALNLLGLTFHFSAIFYILSYWLFRIPIGRSVYIILVLLLNAVYFFKINLLGDLITLVAGWVGGKAEVVAEIYTNSSITREAGVSAVRCPGNHSGTYPAGRVAVGNRPYHGFAYGRSLHRSAHGGAAQRDDRSEQRADRLCPLLACRQPRPDYRPWSGGSGAHPLYLTCLLYTSPSPRDS